MKGGRGESNGKGVNILIQLVGRHGELVNVVAQLLGQGLGPVRGQTPLAAA